MTINIGKAADNELKVQEQDVSRHHARLTRHSLTEEWLLEDLDSTNGTFVNDRQIQKKRIGKADKIRLGNSCSLQLTDILNAVNDYSEDFFALKAIYEAYMREKVRMQSANQFKTRLLQSLPLAIPGLIGIVVGFSGRGNPLLFGLSLGVAVLAPVLGIYLGARQAAKIPHKLQALSDQFKIDYVCPKCGNFLGEIPWESLHNRKQCPVSSCRAKWAQE